MNSFELIWKLQAGLAQTIVVRRFGVQPHTIESFGRFQLAGNTRDYHCSGRSRVTLRPQDPHIKLSHIRNSLHIPFKYIIYLHFIGFQGLKGKFCKTEQDCFEAQGQTNTSLKIEDLRSN